MRPFLLIKLTADHVEKLILLFDYFEVFNGARTRGANQSLQRTLMALTPDRIEDLRIKYRIEPFGEESWRKGFTGGSDDHSGLFIEGRLLLFQVQLTRNEFLANLKKKYHTLMDVIMIIRHSFFNL